MMKEGLIIGKTSIIGEDLDYQGRSQPSRKTLIIRGVISYHGRLRFSEADSVIKG